MQVETPKVEELPTSVWERVDINGSWQRATVCALHLTGPCQECGPTAPQWVLSYWQDRAIGPWKIVRGAWRCKHGSILCVWGCEADHPDEDWLQARRTANGASSGGAPKETFSVVAKRVVKQGADRANEAVNRARNQFNQVEAFAAFNGAMQEMTRVVSVQHARLSDLERSQAELEKRVGGLEAQTSTTEQG